MATGISSPCSRLDPAPDLDHRPLAGRRRLTVQPPAPARAESSPPLPDRCEASVDTGAAAGASQQFFTVPLCLQSWPGLPRGVEFNPSDSDLLWHLAAEAGNGLAERHPFINGFIKSVDDDRGFSHAHPQDIPGVRQDGRGSYFFHRRFESYSNEGDANISWKKIGTSRSIILDGPLQGCKEEFVLYADMASDKSSQETGWRLHQYHIRNTVKNEGELVVSKIFFESRNNPCELAEEARAEAEWFHTEWMIVSGETLQDVSAPDDSREECTTCFNHRIYTETDELDHISLKERHRILLAYNSSCPATVSARKSVIGVETSRTPSKRNHEGSAYKGDICSMLQEISSAPPLVESNPMDDNNNSRLLGEDDPGFSSISGMSTRTDPSLCEVGCSHDPVEGNENQVVGTATCGGENSELVVRKQGGLVADVKLEPALEGYEIDCSESPQANSIHAEGSVPSLGVKDELNECELPGLCEKISFSSRQRRKRKTTSYSTEKMLEEDAYTNDESVAYCSHRRRRKKTATNSIEKALDEDAPGLLEILVNRGITAEEIKLYGAEEDNELIPDSTESSFEDLENVIANLFPKRTSLLKLSVARHEKGEKAIYCLSCLISLIEQSRYLQFRDCPMEWGWCRDLQSFIFVFRSHNRCLLPINLCPIFLVEMVERLVLMVALFILLHRIVLERPEYGYATYFFEVVQSLPIEWQIRRLVTAMKLSGCGRTALIENRPLLVGEDLTEGEARVLEEYGWIRNTGLGTMVNYRDRVAHDRWTEKSVTDWRAKIGKLLMSGYAEGQSITIHGPKKVADLLEATEDAETEIKLEDPF
ncbi:NAC domain-containing protein 8 [Dichanthelium oligosanthes]|uniref:NAC domain-containing protein 8 n=1 Tax=Dichanthelium oligosanthes TaxID=888268 RepID=A0A1E5WEI4_9POAL|nr:NAC domain-containing protein 8 [Dichanthelium oligosanthes]